MLNWTKRHVTTKVHYLSRIVIECDTFFLIIIFVVNVLSEQHILYILQLIMREAAECNQKDVEELLQDSFRRQSILKILSCLPSMDRAGTA